jgi:polysaccharide pyruvyl transferase WcaK-like protein
MAGSDQIWNPIKFGLSKVYYLSFAPQNAQKISYAPSYANFHFTNDGYSNLIVEYLNSFSAISVREEHSCRELNSVGIPAVHVLDPTLLLTKDDWMNALGIKEVKAEKPYLLVYAMSDHLRVYKYAAKIGEKHSLVIKIIGNSCKQLKNTNIEFLPSAGPYEFVELFMGASFLVCNSFHGTAFSVNFNVPFICLDSNLPERINSLLNLTGLSSRQGSLKDNSIKADEWEMNVDFTNANNVLEQERKRSMEYLEDAINVHS